MQKQRNLNAKYAQESFRALSEQAANREYEINSQSSNPIRNSDDDAVSECPIFIHSIRPMEIMELLK